MTSLLINRIYLAIEGEGVRIGIPQVFIRLQGCKIGCLNCDSKETWEFAGITQGIDSIVAEVLKLIQGHSSYWVSLTGGDPLHPHHTQGLVKLSQKLKDQGLKINIEASGTRMIPELFSLMDYISCDFKTPSTGVKTPIKVLDKLIQNYPDCYQIKSVIADRKDFESVVEAYQALQKNGHEDINWVLTPCFETGEAQPTHRVQSIFNWAYEYPAFFRVIVQQHKMIYGSQRLDI